MVSWATTDTVTSYDLGASLCRHLCSARGQLFVMLLMQPIDLPAALPMVALCLHILTYLLSYIATAAAAKNWRIAMLMVLSARKEVLPQAAGGWQYCSAAAVVAAADTAFLSTAVAVGGIEYTSSFLPTSPLPSLQLPFLRTASASCRLGTFLPLPPCAASLPTWLL